MSQLTISMIIKALYFNRISKEHKKNKAYFLHFLPHSIKQSTISFFYCETSEIKIALSSDVLWIGLNSCIKITNDFTESIGAVVSRAFCEQNSLQDRCSAESLHWDLRNKL